MSRDCTNMIYLAPRLQHSPFEGVRTRGEPREPEGVESMDCNMGRETDDDPLPKPTIEVWVEERRFDTVIDTGNAHTFIQNELVPTGYVWKATPIRMMCMHGQSTYYP